MKLPLSFYTRPNVVEIAQELLGKYLVTNFDGQLTSGMIVETEAYSGINDKACHANNGRRTKRTELMFHTGGKAYVYLCYGIHHLFNVTTNDDGQADAVLIRGLEPVDGIDVMLARRGKPVIKSNLTAGPGALAQALAISTNYYGEDLTGELIWIEDRLVTVSPEMVGAGKRVGVDYAEEDALKEWRFAIKGNIWVSKPRI